METILIIRIRFVATFGQMFSWVDKIFLIDKKMKFNIKLKLTTGPSSLAVIDKTSRAEKQTVVSSPSVQRAFFVVKNTIVLVLVWLMSQILVWLKISPVLLSKFCFLSTFKSLKIMFPSLWKTFLYLTLRQRWNMVGLELCPIPVIWLAFWSNNALPLAVSHSSPITG